MLDRRTVILGLAASVPAPALAAIPEHEIGEFYDQRVAPTALAEALNGQLVSLTGFMAPPLTANATFFVLTMSPTPICPYCESEDDFSAEIMPVFTKRVVKVVPFYKQINVIGQLDIGQHRDPDSGFLMPMRLANATYSEI